MDLMALVARLSLDSSEYEQGIDKSKEKVGGLGKGIGTAMKIGAAAIGAATAAVGAFAKSSIDTGAQFDSSMSQVAATMGTTVDQISNLRDFAQEMGSTTAFSASQAADALNYMALAGYDAETSMKMLPNVLNLAAAGGMDLATASDMITDAQSALGLSLEETSNMVDQMAKASSKSNTSIAQLGEAFLTIGATARNVAGGTTELSTVLGVLADNGIKGAEGGTHLRNAILSLQTPTKDGVEALRQLGMTYDDMYDSAGNMRSLPEIFQEMSVAMEGMNQQSKDAIISGIFNKTDLAAINALIGTSADRWDELSKAIEDSGGAAEKAAKTQLDNLNGDLTIMKHALEGAQIALSDALTPALREFVQFGTQSISDLTNAFREGGVEGLMDSLEGVFNNLVAMFAENIPTVIELGVQVLTALINGIVQNLPALMDAAAQIIQILAIALIQNFPILAKSGTDAIISLASGLIQGIPNAIEATNNILDQVIQFITGELPQFLDRGVDAILNMANGLLQGAPNAITSIGEIINKMLDALLTAIPIILEAGVKLIVGLAQGIVQNLPEIVSAAQQVMAQLTATIAEHLPELLAKGIELIGQLAAGIIQAIPDAISGTNQVVANVTQILSGLKGKALTWGLDMIKGFAKGIKNGIKYVGDAIGKVAEKVTGVIHFSRPDEGPLRYYEQWMPDFMKGLASGIESNLWRIEDAMSGVTDLMTLNTDSALSGSSGSTFAPVVNINVYATENQSAEEVGQAAIDAVNREIQSLRGVWGHA